MQQNEAALTWFRDTKFGMFLHWGLYAVEAKGEWYMDKAPPKPKHIKVSRSEIDNKG